MSFFNYRMDLYLSVKLILSLRGSSENYVHWFYSEGHYGNPMSIGGQEYINWNGEELLKRSRLNYKTKQIRRRFYLLRRKETQIQYLI